MKTQMLTSTSAKKPALLAAACGILLLFLGCEKKPNQAAAEAGNPTPPSAQEQKLIGNWQHLRTDLYEITGVDSSGAYTGSLVGSATCDSSCRTRLTGAPGIASNWFAGTGLPGACDELPFSWNARQPGQLACYGNQHYDIEALGGDSLALCIV